MNHTDNSSPFQVVSRKEIILLLRGLKESNQLVNMVINEGSEVIITAILKIDDDRNLLLLDIPSTEGAMERVLKATRVNFETVLNKISIRFSVSGVTRNQFEGTPSLSCKIPSSLIRLQRREFYRVATPVTQPIMCTIPIPEEDGGGSVKLPLVDISCSGVAMLDEKKKLKVDFGTEYPDCKIDLPDIGLVDVTLQVRNSQDLSLMNHKTSRRIGFQFIGLSKQMLAQIQKLITKIERERNARQTGLV